MNLSKFKRNFEQMPPMCGTAPHVCYVPDFTAEQELYRIDNEPINVMNNAEINPVLQNIAQQQMVDVSSSSVFDTSGMSDKELAANCIPRVAEVSDLEDIASTNLRDMDKFYKEQKNL